MKLVPFEPEHLKMIELQQYQKSCEEKINDFMQHAHHFQNGNSFTLFDSEGKVLVIAGIIKIWGNRYAGWSLLSKYAGKHFVYITRAVKKFLETKKNEIERLECNVDTNYTNGHRWAEMLGFEREATLRKFSEDGRDTDMYAIVRN